MKNNTVFVLLAGGKSERMGIAKGLLKYNDSFWILEQLHRISKTTISKVYIGLGFNFEDYFKAIPWLEKAVTNFVNYKNLQIKVCINSTPEFGTFSTLQTVLKQLNKASNILLNHIDIPILNSIDLTKILETENTVVIPSFNTKKGHPVKLSAEFCQSLKTIPVKNENARLDFQIKKLSPANISIIEVNDSVILYNLNTQKEWISFLENAKFN